MGKFLCFLLGFLLAFPAFSKDEKYSFGLVIPKDWKAKANFVAPIPPGKRLALPAEFDWRTVKKLSPIKNQGNCGSCWAFSSAETFRDAMIVQAGEEGDSSEQALLDCNSYGYGCDGGFFSINDYSIQPGAVREALYPYRGVQGNCKPTTSFAAAKSWAYVPTLPSGAPDVTAIKQAIYTYGPVSAGVAASEFSSYTSGVFCGKSQQLNHAIQLVGWSDSKQAFILRNSWGENWGLKGFMYIGYNCNGIGEAANYFVYKGSVPPPDPGPEPTPPPPGPEPTPPPCALPKAATGYAASINSRVGASLLMGKRGEKGVSYVWSANPPFDGGAVPKSPQITYKPRVTKTLTVIATNPCGSASASTRVNIPVSDYYYQ